MTGAIAIDDRPSAPPSHWLVALEARIERVLYARGVWPVAVAILLLLQGTLVLSHQPWLDEWQALQIALESPDLSALMLNLRYEGHPPLWYALLRGTAAIVPPGWVLAVVQFPIAMGLQALILRAPFSRLHRLLIGTSYFVLIDYGTLSRSLGLGVLLLTAAIGLSRRRSGWIAIVLLPMADFLFGVLSIGCILLRHRSQRLWWPGIAGWGLSGLIAGWSVRPMPDMIPAMPLAGPAFDLLVWLGRLSVLLVPLPIGESGLEWNHPWPIPLAWVSGTLFLLFAWRQLRPLPFERRLFAGFTVITALFSCLVYPLAIRHLSLLAWALVLLLWHDQTDRGDRAPDTALRLWFWTIALCGLAGAAATLVLPFDTAPQVAAYIQRAGLSDRHWIAYPDSRGQGVAALTGIRFHRPERDCLQSFVRWNHRSTIRTRTDLFRMLQGVTNRYGRVYLLSDTPIGSGRNGSLIVPIAAFPPGYDGQAYYLYVVGKALPETLRRPPACVPGLRPIPPIQNPSGMSTGPTTSR